MNGRHTPPPAPRVEVHIERVVLTGLDLGAADSEQLRRALGAALTDALAARRADSFDTTADARRSASVHLRAGADPATTGAAIGRAVAGALAPTPTQRPVRS